MMKAKKNDVEAKGMMNASLKDSVALCDFLSLMAEEVSIVFIILFEIFTAIKTLKFFWFKRCLKELVGPSLKLQKYYKSIVTSRTTAKERALKPSVGDTKNILTFNRSINKIICWFCITAGFGPNGAIIHYAPSNETDAIIDTSSLFLLDSGGQYFGII